jgi:hypothetical protein
MLAEIYRIAFVPEKIHDWRVDKVSLLEPPIVA